MICKESILHGHESQRAIIMNDFLHSHTEDDMAKAKDGNKAQMVREAMAQLGNDAKPLVIQEWIMTNYKTEMEAQMISSYKSNEMKKGGSSKSSRGGKGGDIIEDISTVSNLLKKHGRSSLDKLIDALDK
jgi:hypothetical protein